MEDLGLKVQRALKLIESLNVLNPDNLFHEAQVLKALEQDNIVRVEDTGTLKDGRVYVAMEYLAKGSLEDEASGSYVDLTRAKDILADVLRGLHYAHTHHILHRDLKPVNILIGPSRQGKLSDFRLAVPTGFSTK